MSLNTIIFLLFTLVITILFSYNVLIAAERDQAIREKDEAEADAERERTRLAATGGAALGYLKQGELKTGDYGHSASLDDVLKLVADRDRYRDRHAKLREALEAIAHWKSDARVCCFPVECYDVLSADDEAGKEIKK